MVTPDPCTTADIGPAGGRAARCTDDLCLVMGAILSSATVLADLAVSCRFSGSCFRAKFELWRTSRSNFATEPSIILLFSVWKQSSVCSRIRVRTEKERERERERARAREREVRAIKNTHFNSKHVKLASVFAHLFHHQYLPRWLHWLHSGVILKYFSWRDLESPTHHRCVRAKLYKKIKLLSRVLKAAVPPFISPHQGVLEQMDQEKRENGKRKMHRVTCEVCL